MECQEEMPGCYSMGLLFFQVQDIGNQTDGVRIFSYDRIRITVSDPPRRIQFVDWGGGVGKIGNNRPRWNVYIP